MANPLASSIAHSMEVSPLVRSVILTFTCGLSLPAYRMLVTTISSQSRQELPMPTQKAPLQKTSNRFRRPFINRIHRPSHSPQKTHLLGKSENNIDWKLSSIATALTLGIIYINVSHFKIPFNASTLITLILTPMALCIIFPKTIFSIWRAFKKYLDKIDININTFIQAMNFFFPPLLAYLSVTIVLGEPEIPSAYHLFIILFTLIPLLPTLIYTFYQKIHKIENRSINRDFLNKEKIQPQTPFEKLKSASQLVPIIIAISFTFILIQNIMLMDRDIGLAIHLTATEFTYAKYEWISFMLMLTLIVYSTFLFPLALSILYRGFRLIQNSHPFESLRNSIIHSAEKQPATSISTSLIDTQKIISGFLVVLRHFITFILIVIIETIFGAILGLQNSPPIFMCILIFSVMAYLNVNIYILSRKSVNPTKVKKILYSSCLKILVFLAVIFSISFHDSTITSSIKSSILLGKIISSPSAITDSSENARFSCAFLDNPDSPESIAFGVIVSSKDSSIHIFSPSRDEVTGKYTHSAEDGKSYPNKLVETHVKVSERYHIEKFNKSKHWYNSNSGKCVYKNTPPFYISSYPLEHKE